MTQEQAAFTMIDDRPARRNVLLLAVAGSLCSAVTVMLFGSAGLVGTVLAPDRAWATLPLTAFVTGTLIASFPSAMLMKRFGRKPVFIGGAVTGLVGTALAAQAIIWGHFGLFVAACALQGVYQATANYYRFAAADAASDEFRPRAISWVLTGGVAAAFLGTLIVMGTAKLLDPFMFAASYLTGAGLAILAMPVLAALSVPPPVEIKLGEEGRALPQILRDPRFLAAMLSGMISYGLMNLVMTASPIAMVDCGLTVNDAAFALQWHVLAMYVPSFFTGGLITRFGAARITAAGLFLLGAAGVVALSGIAFHHFAIALILLGLGWNFGFIGATALLTRCYSPAERDRAQGINEFAISATVAFASLSSGKILAAAGWSAVNLTVFPAVAISLALLLWLQSRPGPVSTRT
jgi:MFS family permease